MTTARTTESDTALVSPCNSRPDLPSAWWLAAAGHALQRAGGPPGPVSLVASTLDSALLETVLTGPERASSQPLAAAGSTTADLVLLLDDLFHRPKPLPQLSRAWANVRAGGLLLVLERDLLAMRSEPPHPVFERVLRLLHDGFRRRTLDLDLGSRVPALLIEAGCKAAWNCEVTSRVSAADEAVPVLLGLLDAVAPTLLRLGLLDADGLARSRAELQACRAQPVTLRWPDLVATWVHKPF